MTCPTVKASGPEGVADLTSEIPGFTAAMVRA